MSPRYYIDGKRLTKTEWDQQRVIYTTKPSLTKAQIEQILGYEFHLIG